jgi:hypothetical protein
MIKIRNGLAYNEDGVLIAIMSEALPDDIAREAVRAIEYGTEVAPKVDEFIQQVNSGKFKPRATVKMLEQVAQKYT